MKTTISNIPGSTNPFLDELAHADLLDHQAIVQTLTQAHASKQSVIETLLRQQKLSAKIIAQQLAQYLQLAFFDLSQIQPDTIIQDIIDETFIRQYQLLPLFIKNQQLYVAISDIKHLEYIHEIKFHTDLNIYPVVVEWDKLTRLIEIYLSSSQYRCIAQSSISKIDIENDDRIILWAEQLLQDAIQKNTSDIHIEPYKTAYRIRFRLDGILYKITQIPLETGIRLTARLKIMSRLDIAERRLPQDGRFTFEKMQETKDCRISICPTLFGEKTVIRILDAGKMSLNIDDLGFENTQKALFFNVLKKPQGLVLVTGPTGSGKTVTLYSALNYLNNLEKNICSVEDPVEITLPGINQIHVDSKIDLSFAKVLRSFLRQDPDILMVGEIRDQETAEIAVKASQTGHLVFSTLHTNSAAETLSRLSMLGISPFNIANATQLIIAQRLVRKLCHHCKKLVNTSNEITYQAVGCEHCIQGYRGRIAVFECLSISTKICAMIIQNKSSADIAATAKQEGMLSLKESAINKIKCGITSVEEIQRVLL